MSHNSMCNMMIHSWWISFFSSTLKEGLEYCRKLQRPDGSWEGWDYSCSVLPSDMQLDAQLIGHVWLKPVCAHAQVLGGVLHLRHLVWPRSLCLYGSCLQGWVRLIADTTLYRLDLRAETWLPKNVWRPRLLTCGLWLQTWLPWMSRLHT